MGGINAKTACSQIFPQYQDLHLSKKKKTKTETRQFFKNSLPTEWFRSSERTSSSFLVRAYSKYKNINIDHLFLMYASQLQKIKWQHKEDKTAWSLYLSVKQK